MLAPEIQEELLFLPRVERGRQEVRLRDLQKLATVIDWKQPLHHAQNSFIFYPIPKLFKEPHEHK